MPDYSYVVSPSFNPFNMQEMLVPFSAYKDAFEKSEEQYNDLADRSDKFKYLSETLPEGSKARQIYEGYANDLKTQAEDLAHNGLTMGNRRALTSLKRRYQGEIGRLLEADEAMREEKKLRRSINAQDHSMLYADDNLSIDNFLDGNTPNLYSISGNELYARGAEAGKAFSSREIKVGDRGATLGGMFRDWVQQVGYSPETIAAFRQNAANIPALNDMVDDIMNASGASQNLTGFARGQARQQIINGVINGAIYQESHNPIRDPNVLSAAEKAQIDMQQKNFNLNKSQLERQYMAMGYRLDDKGRPYRDEQLVKDIVAMKQASKGKSGGSSSSGEDAVAKDAVSITWNGNPKDGAKETKTTHFKDDDEIKGEPIAYENLPQWAKDKVDAYTNNGNEMDYTYYYQPYKPGFWGHDDEVITIVPTTRRTKNYDPSLDWGNK